MVGAARRWTATAAAVALALVALGGCTKDHGSEADFCREVKRIPTLDAVVTGFVDTEPSALDARLDDASKAYATLEDAAPDDVRDSVSDMTALVDAVLAAVRAHPDDPEAAARDLRAAVKDHPNAARSSLAVASYASEHCGVELNPKVVDTTSTTAVSGGSSPDPSSTGTTAAG
ncbi:hypothetical protein KSP35_08230 [Aquihabitans sp. G128]|uniref:hypothetical protein n=1 Tax=Aquihabitans sp. G128 TaxID=2849779 RepID=UPI001C24463C|nr:hypothetical protein [Aquihabitans sp. G128]QXC62761.1 hypothetical protein KSP35_08230 [Aquihabitans sp. G128]